jgi:hypothetical protein
VDDEENDMPRTGQSRKREGIVVDPASTPTMADEARAHERRGFLGATPGAARAAGVRSQPVRLIDLERRARFFSFVARGV